MRYAYKPVILSLMMLFIGLGSVKSVCAETELQDKYDRQTPSSSLVIKLRFMSGFRQQESAEVITSYYLKPFFSGSIKTGFKVEKEIEELKNVFHLNEVQLLDEAELSWNSSTGQNAFYQIQLNGNEYLVSLTPNPRKLDAQFGVEISEKKASNIRNLLHTQLILPYTQVAVLGFQDSEQKSYFISFHVQEGVMGGMDGGWEGDVAGGVGGSAEFPIINWSEAKQSRTNNIPNAKEISDKQIPRLIKRVVPKVPNLSSINNRAEETVVVEALIDVDGKVKDARIITGAGYPWLNHQALSAVKQWVYEPYRENGNPTAVKFRVTVNFIFTDISKDEGLSKVVSEMIFSEMEIATSSIPPLKKKVEPAYPPLALKAKLRGIVALQAAIDNMGKVTKAQVISGHPLLNKAAVDAVKQWVYQPYTEKGIPYPVQFPVYVEFILPPANPVRTGSETETSNKTESPRNTSQEEKIELPKTETIGGLAVKRIWIKPLKLVKRVTPVYPKMARDKRIQGIVLLEARTDAAGNISFIKVLQGHPALVEAAVNAVKQWKYEPYSAGDHIVPVVFSITVNFTLND